MKSEKSASLNPERIYQTAKGHQQSRILLTAFELDVFSRIESEGSTSEDVAEKIAADPRATDRLLNALCAMNFLEKRDHRFFNTEESAKFLVKSSPDYQGGLMHTANLFQTWGRLTDVVKTGKPAPRPEMNDRGHAWIEPFIQAMHSRGFIDGDKTASLIDLENVKTVLDVGGGSGAYSMGFVRAKEGLTATVFDLPNVVGLTRGYIEQEGFVGKIDTVAGDFKTDDFGSGYDLVFLSAIVHMNSMAENERLIAKCVNALNPGGQVVVQDFIMDEDRTTPTIGALFALNMLVGTKQGDTFTADEISGWMKRAGLTNITFKQGPKTGLVLGTKPKQ